MKKINIYLYVQLEEVMKLITQNAKLVLYDFYDY